MMAYKNIDKESGHLTYDWIERVVKTTKTHCSILDQERGYIEEVWRESIDA